MSDLAKRQENGQKGEARTLAFVSDSFWVWKRSVDVDGADFLLQQPADTLKELRDRQRQVEAMGIVQSKFFEGHNEVQIEREYVLDAEGPRSDFFASIHTDDAAGDHMDYFFSCPEIQQHFRSRENKDGKEVFVFSLGQDRDYSAFKNIPPRVKNERILAGMKATTLKRNEALLSKVFQHPQRETPGMARPVQVSEFQWKMSDAAADYVWEKQGPIIIAKKIDRSTGVTSTMTSPPSEPHKYNFDPTTGTYSTPSFEY